MEKENPRQRKRTRGVGCLVYLCRLQVLGVGGEGAAGQVQVRKEDGAQRGRLSWVTRPDAEVLLKKARREPGGPVRRRHKGAQTKEMVAGRDKGASPGSCLRAYSWLCPFLCGLEASNDRLGQKGSNTGKVSKRAENKSNLFHRKVVKYTEFEQLAGQ